MNGIYISENNIEYVQSLRHRDFPRIYFKNLVFIVNCNYVEWQERPPLPSTGHCSVRRYSIKGQRYDSCHYHAYMILKERRAGQSNCCSPWFFPL